MSLYKDASLVMIPSAYKDGRLYSIRPVEELGSELVTNGDFATDSDWTKASNWTISGGKAVADGSSQGALSQNIATSVIGKKYKISFTISNYNSGDIRMYYGGQFTSFASRNGVHSATITATTAEATLMTSINTAFNGYIDNVSVKEAITANGDFDFSRGSNLAATRVDVNGLIEKGRENQAPYSNTYNSWVQTSVSLTSNQSGYDNSSDAWLIQSSATNSAAYINQNYTHSGVFTMSVYAKKGTSNWMALATTGSHFAHFDLENGVVGVATGANIIDHKIQSVGNGWYRCSMTSRGFSNFYVFIANGDNDRNTNSGDNIYIQDFQLEQGLVATDYIETGTSAAQSGILEDMPRLDYSGGASCPSLLLEPQRTNLVNFSTYFDGWTKGRTSITSNEAISPDGLKNASYLYDTTDSGTHRVYSNNISVTSGQSQALTLYAKAGTFDTFRMKVNQNNEIDLNFGNFDFDLTNGTCSNSGGSIESMGDGWYKCTAVGSVNASVSSRMFIYLINNSGQVSYTGTGNDYIQIYGAQYESNVSYPTSYIPTYGTSQTRSADTTNSSGLDVSGFHTGEDFTMFVDLAKNESLARDNSSGGVSIRKANQTAGSLRIYRASGSATTNWVVWFDDSSVQNPLPKRIEGDNPKVAIKRIYTTGEWKVFVNGVAVWTKYNTNYSPMANLQIIAGGSPQELKGVTLFDTALTDSECIALTTL